MVDIRFHHVIVAFFIAVLCHTLAIYSINLIKNTQEPLVLPRVIEAMLIASPQPIPTEPLITESRKTELPEPEPAKPVAATPAITPEQPALDQQSEPAISVNESPRENTDIDTKSSPSDNTTEVDTNAALAEPAFTPPKVDAKSRDNPPPVYPRIARRMGQEGTVMLEVFILADGTVGDVKLKTTSGHARLDDSAMEAVRHWRYTPARLGDKAISHWYTQSVKFVLN